MNYRLACSLVAIGLTCGCAKKEKAPDKEPMPASAPAKETACKCGKACTCKHCGGDKSADCTCGS